MNFLKLKVKKSDIPSGKAKSFKIGDSKIVVCNLDNSYYAISDVCTHDDGELVSGECDLIQECLIECPRHGARFDVRTGEAKRMPAVVPVKSYKVSILGDELEIDLGNT